MPLMHFWRILVFPTPAFPSIIIFIIDGIVLDILSILDYNTTNVELLNDSKDKDDLCSNGQ